jgi:spore coat polysaccharide biosynthesis protein SpsF
MNYTEVIIGIQARSSSTRFPKKIYQNICGKRVLDWVVDAAKSSANHAMKYSGSFPLRCQVAILHPEDDTELVNAFRGAGCLMIGGSEHNVLDRYLKAQAFNNADYVVRLTSDCPLILDYMITKHINTAIKNGYDYVCNVDETGRTVADGLDCEIMSRKMINWLTQNAVSDSDKEHVTTAIRRLKPSGFRRGMIMTKFDTSDMKLSLDTPEDLDRIRSYMERKISKDHNMRSDYGRGNVFEL